MPSIVSSTVPASFVSSFSSASGAGNTSGIPVILYKSGAAFLVNHFLLQHQAVKTATICDDDRGECLLHLPYLFATGLCHFWGYIATPERVSRNNHHSFKHRCC